jgi:hypothetical protein
MNLWMKHSQGGLSCCSSISHWFDLVARFFLLEQLAHRNLERIRQLYEGS